jgi:hypothetical protein
MRTISRLFGLTCVIAGLLAISASAAQAMPLRASNDTIDSAAVNAGPRTTTLHRTGFQIALTPDGAFALPAANGSSAGQAMQPAVDSPTAQVNRAMQPAVDSPTDQTAPLIISQPVPVAKTVASDSGFGWVAFLVGAGVAALLLVLAGFAATHIRPRQMVRL